MNLKNIEIGKLSEVAKAVLVTYALLKVDYDGRESARAPRLITFPNGEQGYREPGIISADRPYYWIHEALTALPDVDLQPALDQIRIDKIRHSLRDGLFSGENEVVENMKLVEHKFFQLGQRIQDWTQVQAEAELAQIEQSFEQSTEQSI